MRVVHIGFPKTATTFLQRRVFPALADHLTYLDSEIATQLFDPLIQFDDSVFNLEESRRRFASICANHDKVVISHEPLTGLEYRSAFVNRTQIANRLKAIGCDRVIITIRNQFEALESAYKQYVKSGGVLTFDRYVRFDRNSPEYFYPEYLDYDRIYRIYAELFGRDDVLVLQYEDLADGVIGALLSFLGLKHEDIDFGDRVNPSLSCRKTRILRWINHFTYSAYSPSHPLSSKISTALFYRLLEPIDFLGNGKPFLDDEARERVAAFYSESNSRLSQYADVMLDGSYP